MNDTRNTTRYWAAAVCGILLLIVVIVFGQTVRHDFVNFDDGMYVCENPGVRHGLTGEAVAWSFTTFHAGNWHPLTWLSHALDCELYGMEPWGHHLTNVLLHAIVAILLFLVFWRMTGDLWPSAFVAAVFAVHPLRAESVAWVAERKDLLSGLFFVLTIAAYVDYVRRPFSLMRYLLVAVLFALGLMAKPMLVTLPFVLLLLDYWPLGRMRDCTWRRLLAEKLPLFAMAAASCAATSMAQQVALITVEKVPMSSRIANALVSSVAYIGQLFYPTRLAAFYVYPKEIATLWKLAGSLAVLVGVSTLTLVWIRKRPFLFVGWFWYLGMLVPVVGLVQVGSQAMADRYTYLPQIGLCVAIAWGASQIASAWPYRRWAFGIASVVIVIVLMACARLQTSHWRNSVTLWTHAIDCDERNVVAYNNLGTALLASNKPDAAIAQYRKALAIRPDLCYAYNNLGNALFAVGRIDEAALEYRKAFEHSPTYAIAHNNLGSVLEKQGKIDAAIAEYLKTTELAPDFADAYNNLGSILASRGQLDAAIVHFRKALKCNRDFVGAHNNLGLALERQRKMTEALTHWREAVRLDPKNIRVINHLAWLLATQPESSVRNGREAVELAQWAVQLSKGQEPIPLGTLAAAYAEIGRYSDAVKTADRAITLATAQGDAATADALRKQIQCYRTGKPYREPPATRLP